MSDDGSPLHGGGTQALDVNDILSKRKKKQDDDWEKGNNWHDPWSDGPKDRNWAEDDRWAGDDAAPKQQDFGGGGTMALDLNNIKSNDGALADGNPPEFGEGADSWETPGSSAGRGWSAPKRDEVLGGDGGGGWDDWNDGGMPEGGTMALALDNLEEQKELGGRRKRQAAKSYEADDTSAYGDGRSRRKDIYKAKEDSEFDRGLSSYEGGKRASYGAQESFDGDGWSTSPVAGSGRPAQAPPGMSQSPPGMSQSPPSTLPPSERTVALDINSGSVGTAAPNESTMALDVGNASDFLAQQNPGPGAGPGDEPTVGSLVIFTQNAQPVVYELSKGVTSIGRGLENNVVLSDPYSSRKHFLVVYKDGNFEVRDSGTDNGTCVNGHRVTHALLQHGDHIEVGSTILKFVPGVAGAHEMQFGPPPPRMPHHLAPPPEGTVAPGMMGPPLQAPPKKGKGLLFLFIFLVLVLLGGGAALAVYFFAYDGGSESKSSSKDDDDDTETSTSSMDTGYQAGGADGSDKRIAEAMEDHEIADSKKDKPKDKAGAAKGDKKAAAGDKKAAAGDKTDTAAAAGGDADPILVAGLVGSVAMATGKARPLEMTVFPTDNIKIIIKSDPIDAEIYDEGGNLRGHTPYEISEPAAKRTEKWTVKKVGFKTETLKVDFSKGLNEDLSLGKRSRRKPKEDKRPEKTSIPTVD